MQEGGGDGLILTAPVPTTNGQHKSPRGFSWMTPEEKSRY